MPPGRSPSQSKNPASISLLDLLRRRRELSLDDVVRLCEDLPALLDERPPDAPTCNLLLSCVAIDFGGAPPERDVLALPLEQWPAFALRLESDEPETLDRTIVVDTVESAASGGPAALARLLYDLLGGTHRAPGTARRFPPLPALNEEGNAVLREALLAKVTLRETCANFWNRWLRACEVFAQPTGWRI